MFVWILLIILGFALLIKGADFLVDGASNIAKKFHIPEIIIGLTIVSIGTSMPELFISITSAIRGSSDMAIGNVIGSNIANLLLILGLSSVIRPIKFKRETRLIEMPLCLGISIIFAALCNVGQGISRIDSSVLMVLFALFIMYTIIMAKQGEEFDKGDDDSEEDDNKVKTSKSTIRDIIFLILGVFRLNTVNAANIPDAIAASDTPHSITVTREVEDVTNPVTNTFTYTITQDSSNPDTVTGAPTTLQIAFNGENPNASNVASKSGTIDFTGATFAEPGNYRFIIAETGSTNSTTYPTSSDTYYIYVSVRYDTTQSNDTLVATLLSQGRLVGDDETDPTNKTDIVFSAPAEFTNISITKTVTGDMGSKTKYFDIKVTIPGNTGDTYVVSRGQYGTSSTSTTTVTANTETTLQIKHGETLVIGLSGSLNQIPINQSYTVAETAVTNYDTTIDGNVGLTITKTSDEDPTNNITAIINAYTSNPLTGSLLTISPFLGLILIALLGIILIRRKKEEN